MLVRELWRYPVKAMRGERVPVATLARDGMLGDRAFAILDVESNGIAFASNVRDFPLLLGHQARLVAPPEAGRPLPPVEITSPCGATVRSDDPDVHQVLSRWLGRSVRLVAAPPPGHLESRARFLAGLGCADTGTLAPLQDAYPLSVISTATLAALAEATPGAVFDVRRFRMNVLVDATEQGFPENDWVGRGLALGEARITVMAPDPRCVVTTLAVDGLPRDPRILRTIASANSVAVGPAGTLPCAGVYATVVTPGAVQVGDAVIM